MLTWPERSKCIDKMCRVQDFDFAAAPQSVTMLTELQDDKPEIDAAPAHSVPDPQPSPTTSLWSCPFCNLDCNSSHTAQAYQGSVSVRDSMSQQDDTASAVQMHLDADACMQLLQVQASRFAMWGAERQQACRSALDGRSMLTSIYLAGSLQDQTAGGLRIAALQKLLPV